MNQTTETIQDSLQTELLKEGVRIAEAPLKALLQQRAALVKSLYAKEMSDAAFNRAKAEEEMIKLVAGYNVAVEDLLKSYTQEMDRLRSDNHGLRTELAEAYTAYQMKAEGEEKLLNVLLERSAA